MVAHGALIRAGVKWIDYRSCPVNPDVIQTNLNDNPYISPRHSESKGNAYRLSVAHGWKFWIYAICALLIGLIPSYGYFAHVGDPQETVFVMMLAWLATPCNAILLFLATVLRWWKNETHLYVGSIVFLAIIALLYYGFHGIGKAVAELWIS